MFDNNNNLPKSTIVNISKTCENLVKNGNAIKFTSGKCLDKSYPNYPKIKFYNFIQNYCWLFPFIGGVMIPPGIIGIYLSAIAHDHVHPIFPYLSEIGTHNPQAAMFCMALSVLAILGKLLFILLIQG